MRYTSCLLVDLGFSSDTTHKDIYKCVCAMVWVINPQVFRVLLLGYVPVCLPVTCLCLSVCP